jgi:hypothetical protein
MSRLPDKRGACYRRIWPKRKSAVAMQHAVIEYLVSSSLYQGTSYKYELLLYNIHTCNIITLRGAENVDFVLFQIRGGF